MPSCWAWRCIWGAKGQLQAAFSWATEYSPRAGGEENGLLGLLLAFLHLAYPGLLLGNKMLCWGKQDWKQISILQVPVKQPPLLLSEWESENTGSQTPSPKSPKRGRKRFLFKGRSVNKMMGKTQNRRTEKEKEEVEFTEREKNKTLIYWNVNRRQLHPTCSSPSCLSKL